MLDDTIVDLLRIFYDYVFSRSNKGSLLPEHFCFVRTLLTVPYVVSIKSRVLNSSRVLGSREEFVFVRLNLKSPRLIYL